MKVLFDTNVAVAALVATHPKHTKAYSWLKRAKEKKINGVMGLHTLAEIYSILTTLPIQPKISPSLAERLIQQDILPNFTFIELNREDYQVAIHVMVENNVQGGATYDALIAHAAFKAKVNKLLTFNDKHFKKVYPTIAHLIEVPS